MSTGKPASLDGSLLARKGAAEPAIPPNSPLTEELGEPRPEPVPVSLGAVDAAAARPGGAADPEARHRLLSVFLLVILAAAILFAASRLLPTAATVKGPSLSDQNRVETAAAENSVGSADGPVETAAGAAADGVGSAVSAPVAPTSPTNDIAAAKKSPVVAVVPRTTKLRRPKSRPAIRSGRYLLQLASLPSARDARKEVTRLQNRLRGVLGTRKITVVRAVPKGKGPVYRLRASAYPTRNSARAACDRIKKLKVGCLVVRR